MGCLPLIALFLVGTGAGYALGGRAGSLWGAGTGLALGLVAGYVVARLMRNARGN